MFWIREALVVPDDLHAIVICIDKSVDDAGGDEGEQSEAGGILDKARQEAARVRADANQKIKYENNINQGRQK